MPRYNILRDRDERFDIPDEKEKKAAPTPKEPKSDEPVSSPDAMEPEAPADDFFSDDLFSADPIVEEQAPAETDVFDLDAEPVEAPEPGVTETLDDQSFEEPSDFSAPEEAVDERPAAPQQQQRQPIVYTYEDDEKHSGINYKPALIGLAVVAAAVVIFFVVSNLFFSESAEEVPPAAVETQAEIMAREAEEAKQRVLAELVATNQKKIGAIQVLAGLDQKNVKYSSILLYGNSLSLEVFAPDRDALAKFNQTLKSNNSISQYKIEAVNTRAGSKGGVFALYDINPDAVNVAGAASVGTIQMLTPESWSASAPNQAGLKVNSNRPVSTRQENQFRVSRQEFELRGPLKNCLALLEQMGRTMQNTSVHKLTLVSANQQMMSTSSFILRLTVDFYL